MTDLFFSLECLKTQFNKDKKFDKDMKLNLPKTNRLGEDLKLLIE